MWVQGVTIALQRRLRFSQRLLSQRKIRQGFFIFNKTVHADARAICSLQLHFDLTPFPSHTHFN